MENENPRWKIDRRQFLLGAGAAAGFSLLAPGIVGAARTAGESGPGQPRPGESWAR